ncbi:DUF4145 domain-containing protein [Enterococcus faecalis]|nr:DUF4145 domain-containing protein [Enterococcus faecalis]
MLKENAFDKQSQLLFNHSFIDWQNNSYSLGTCPNEAVTQGTICPQCGAFTGLQWVYGLGGEYASSILKYTLIKATCTSCKEISIWLKDGSSDREQQIYPRNLTSLPLPNTDMPEDIRAIYEEARNILNDSPRASAALSRLAIDNLTKKLDPAGTNLNDRIKNLVAKGLSVQAQQALDIVRVVGNNAVHPGEIDLTDNKNIAVSLLELVNFIVDNQISQPNKIDSLFQTLPEGALKAIQKRDS